MSFLIRAFAPSDLQALHAIRTAAFAPVFASFRAIVGPEIAALGLSSAEQEQADLLEAIAKPDSGHTLAVAEAGNAITGFVSWKPNIAPGIGYPTGWQPTDVVWGPTQSIGIGAWAGEGGSRIVNTTWGRIKDIYR